MLTLPLGASAEVRKRISLAQMSTRRHHAGVHAVDLVVNGVPLAAARFEVVAGPARAPVSRRAG